MALPVTAAPLILAHNVFDWVHQFPQAALAASSELVGSEVRKVANYRRDRDAWQATSDLAGVGAHWVMSDLGSGNLIAADYAFIDRGHNLWGRSVGIIGSLDNVTYDRTVLASTAVPADPGLGVGTGDPTTGWAVTEEGALYTLAAAATSTARYWRTQIAAVASFIPRLTGVMIGLRHQLAIYSSEVDEDAGDRVAPTERSTMGMKAQGRTVAWRKLTLNLALIGSTEYDSNIRGLRRLLFDKGVPVAGFVNYGRWPYRGSLYRYASNSWSARLRGVNRETMIALEEEGHRTYVP